MSFIKAYSDHAARLTDAPPIFHAWVAIALLAAALGNNAWVWAWGRRICANLWLMLLAPSGIYRKTTAINIGGSILTGSLPESIYPSEWSFEALLQTMGAKPGGILLIRELRRFMQALSRDYAAGAKELLVDTYDNPEVDVRRTRMGGETKVQFPALTLIGASTNEWFEASLRADDVGGGFLSRLFVIPAHERGDWRGLGVTRSDADRLQRESLAEHLKRVNTTMHGELDIAPIKDTFNDWLRRYEESWASRCTPDLAGTIARSGANALKLSMIFQADTEPSTSISLETFDKAREMVEFANDQTARLLAEGLGLDREARERRRVAEAIRRAHPDALEHSVALQNLHLSATALARHIQTLVEADAVGIEHSRRGAGTGRPGKAYRWLNGANP